MFKGKVCEQVGERFLLSQKDVGKIGTLKIKPIYDIVFTKRFLSLRQKYRETAKSDSEITLYMSY